MHPDRGIVCTYIRLDGISTRPDDSNTLNRQPAATKNYPRDCSFLFQDLTSLELSSARQIILLKSAWMNSKIFPLALNRMSINSAIAVPVHSVLNIPQGVIIPKLILRGVIPDIL